MSLEESDAFLQQEKDKNRQITVALSQARKEIEKRINENEGEINIAKQLQQRAIDSLQVSFNVNEFETNLELNLFFILISSKYVPYTSFVVSVYHRIRRSC